MNSSEMIFVIEIKRLWILSLWKCVDKGHYSNGLIGLLQELPSSFVRRIKGCLSNGNVPGFSHCALPQEGASGLPWSSNFLLVHCLMTAW